ncbi:hypothetical protein AB0L57_05990 [Nocardia sp. NPDC052254]
MSYFRVAADRANRVRVSRKTQGGPMSYCRVAADRANRVRVSRKTQEAAR